MNRDFGGFDRNEMKQLGDDLSAMAKDMQPAAQELGKSMGAMWWAMIPTPMKVVMGVVATGGVILFGAIIYALVT